MAKVLLVDDEAEYREYLMSFLTEDGHDVQTAGSGKAAVAVGQTFVPDLLIVDWMLQDELSGADVIERILEANDSLRSIIITGYPASQLAPQVAKFDEVHFLEKPFDDEAFMTCVRRVLGHAAG